MASDRFEQALVALDPSKRALLKRVVAAAAFAVPAISSFAVANLASAQASCTTTTTTIGVRTVTVTLVTSATTTTTSVRTVTVTAAPPG